MFRRIQVVGVRAHRIHYRLKLDGPKPDLFAAGFTLVIRCVIQVVIDWHSTYLPFSIDVTDVERG
jgi:hypothetical protein